MFSLQLSLVSVADNSHFCLFHINPYAKHKIRNNGKDKGQGEDVVRERVGKGL